jgi:hypothetical protein
LELGADVVGQADFVRDRLFDRHRELAETEIVRPRGTHSKETDDEC